MANKPKYLSAPVSTEPTPSVKAEPVKARRSKKSWPLHVLRNAQSEGIKPVEADRRIKQLIEDIKALLLDGHEVCLERFVVLSPTYLPRVRRHVTVTRPGVRGTVKNPHGAKFKFVTQTRVGTRWSSQFKREMSRRYKMRLALNYEIPEE